MVSVIFAVLEVSFWALTTVVKLPWKFLTLILFSADEILYNLEPDLFRSLFSTQLQLHFRVIWRSMIWWLLKGTSFNDPLTRFQSLGMVSLSYSILTTYVLIPETKQDTGRKLHLLIPLCIQRPCQGGFPSEYFHTVWYSKNCNGVATVKTFW